MVVGLDRSQPPPVACALHWHPGRVRGADGRVPPPVRRSTWPPRSRTATAISFRFRAGPGVEDWVRDLARREKACCAFFDFTVTAGGQEVRWDVTVADDEPARQVLAGFYRLAGPRE